MTINYRADFDIPRDICYLNAAYMTPQPRDVVTAAMRGATLRSQPWHITPPGFFRDVEALRDTFAHQVGCSSDNIAIVPSAGYGVSCAAINMPLSKGGIVLAMHEQFPSNYYAWRRQAVLSGAEFHVVNKEAGQSWADALLEAIRELGDRIEIATLEGHHWASAEFVDLEVVIPALRDVGAKVVLDLTQSIGGCPVDISRLSPDFMATSGYKWQFCPYGVAFLYVDDQYFDGVPVEEAWMNRDGAEDFSRLADFTDSYQPGARRFDMSEKSSFSNIAGALAALQKLEEWGIDVVSAQLATVNSRIAEILGSHGFETMAAEDRAPHFQGARLPATDPRKLAARLIENRVFASVRGDYLRVAPHLYTDDTDLLRLDEALSAALA
ncbi:MAG: aminotransferase class V-fold PLP-dependent enzyme [Gammaproteobacteria bacterium]|jgi:selenocysteine lyase/cysteine desulfurase|nr:aminotransferase class V-fold PLP-dependent enzyme [Gammaproteobacteria bacterium]MDH3906405.1 aminotransferase class V-fold PLP-dependent enzyme [Gammaproteobacteria bacterium]MDH3984433.1 aminotransferase class V-fold PLP-dependent enzyme [Gammaproteobacteria bacterium]